MTPDLTILLDVNVEIGLARKGKSIEWNRLDAMDREFHERVREGYLRMAEIDARWIVIDANNGIERVHHDLISEVTKRLSFIGLIERDRSSSERI